MLKAVPTAELYAFVEETLYAGSSIILTAIGNSMLPMLQNQRDTVTINPVTTPMSVNDVVLYKRENKQFVMHRIVGLESNGDYILCGDNQFALEHHISHRQVIGRLQAFTHKGRRISCASPFYKSYVCLLPALRFIKRQLCIGRRYISALKRRMRC